MDPKLLSSLRLAVASVLNIKIEQLTPDASPETIDNWDSLATINLAVAIESEFGIHLLPEEIASFTNFQAISDIVATHVR